MALQCSNKKPDGSWCGVPIEWRQVGQKPDGSPKKRPFEIDTDEMHNCPYYKPMKNFKQVAQKVEQEITTNPSVFKKNDALGRVVELETQVQADIKDIHSRLLRAEQAIQALVKELSFKPASKLDKKYEEPVDEEEVLED